MITSEYMHIIHCTSYIEYQSIDDILYIIHCIRPLQHIFLFGDYPVDVKDPEYKGGKLRGVSIGEKLQVRRLRIDLKTNVQVLMH